MADRTLGDVVDPYRPGSATEIVNATTRVVGQDTAGWRWVRLLGFAVQLEQERATLAE